MFKESVRSCLESVLDGPIRRYIYNTNMADPNSVKFEVGSLLEYLCQTSYGPVFESLMVEAAHTLVDALTGGTFETLYDSRNDTVAKGSLQ